jgi:hypothetical protein
MAWGDFACDSPLVAPHAPAVAKSRHNESRGTKRPELALFAGPTAATGLASEKIHARAFLARGHSGADVATCSSFVLETRLVEIIATSLA